MHKFGVSKIHLWKKLILQQGCIKLIKSDSKDIYNVKKKIYVYFK